MAIVQDILINKMIDFLDGLIQGGKVKIDGTYHNYTEVLTFRDKNILRKYIKLDIEEGNIQEAQLISAYNEVLAVKPYDVTKGKNGIAIAFEFKLVLEEG